MKTEAGKTRKVNIFSKGDEASEEVGESFRFKLEKAGFEVVSAFDPEAEFIVCIGGDGSLLNTLAALQFPNIPIVGVNTGHLGFFQELQTDELDEFILRYKENSFTIQKLKTLRAHILDTEDAEHELLGLNEIVIHGAHSHVVYLNIFIDDGLVETFRGDGIIVSTPAGSTAYNYALGGSIVDPRLDLLQITPIAPINNSAYRSFTSGVLLPPHLSVNVIPEFVREHDILVAADGVEHTYTRVKRIHVEFSGERVQLLRFLDYDFWNKVKQKLL
jgi:NAD+ kinase